MERAISKASILIEALPYIRSFHNKTVVVKYGGAAMVENALKKGVALDIILMRYVGIKPVLVHGGGPQIARAMEKAGLEPRFINGLRVTDEATMAIVETVMVGQINQEIVALLNENGGKAVGLSGKDGGLIRAKRALLRKRREDGSLEEVDIGLVGEVVEVNVQVIHALEERGFIPVIAPTGVGEDGLTYNINADLAAGEIAAALKAEKLVLLTDTDGILDRKGGLISTLSRKEIEGLIADGTISEGMLPKVRACLRALDGGVRKAHIINGKVPHALLLEIFTPEGVGTEIIN